MVRPRYDRKARPLFLFPVILNLFQGPFCGWAPASRWMLKQVRHDEKLPTVTPDLFRGPLRHNGKTSC